MATPAASTLTRAFDGGADRHRGGADPDVTLTVYGDYECPYTRLAYRGVQGAEERLGQRMRFVYRHLPLTEVHAHALAAALAAESAAAAGRFWEMHDELFGHQHALERAHLRGYALAAGVDAELYARGFDDQVGMPKIEADVRGALESGARGTPTLFVGERMYGGPYDTDALTAVLEHAAG